HVQRVRARRLAAGAAVRPRRARGRRGAGEDARVSARPRPARRGPRGDRGGPDGMRPAPDPLLLALLRGDEAASATAEDWRRAATAARAEGLEPWLFRRVVRSASAAPGDVREVSYTLGLARDAHGGVVVEPHWTLAYTPFADALDMERVWARCRRGRVVGEPALLLAPEATLLNLCLHLVHKAPDVPLL